MQSVAPASAPAGPEDASRDLATGRRRCRTQEPLHRTVAEHLLDEGRPANGRGGRCLFDGALRQRRHLEIRIVVRCPRHRGSCVRKPDRRLPAGHALHSGTETKADGSAEGRIDGSVNFKRERDFLSLSLYYCLLWFRCGKRAVRVKDCVLIREGTSSVTIAPDIPPGTGPFHKSPSPLPFPHSGNARARSRCR